MTNWRNAFIKELLISLTIMTAEIGKKHFQTQNFVISLVFVIHS